jgi:hypothetical protein
LVNVVPSSRFLFACRWPPPENTKATDNLHLTLAQLVLGSYELEAADKAKQIEGQVVKQVPAE